MPLDATGSPERIVLASTLAESIRHANSKRDRLSLALDAASILAPEEWKPLLRKLLEARQFERDDDEEAAALFEEAMRLCGEMQEACQLRLEDPEAEEPDEG